MSAPRFDDAAWARKFWLRTVIVATFLMVTYLFLFSRHGLLDILRLQAQKKVIAGQILHARVEREDLAHYQSRLQGDTTYILQRAYTLGMARPGDILVRFESDRPTPAAPATP